MVQNLNTGASSTVQQPSVTRGLKRLSMRKNFVWTFSGSVVYAACQWGMLTVLAKFGTPVMVGQFALGMALSAPVVLFAGLQLRNIQATDAKHLYAFGDYLGLRLVTTLLAFCAIAAIGVLGGYTGDTLAVILVVGLSKSVEGISEQFFGLLQQHERMDRAAMRMIVKGILALILLSVALFVTQNIVIAVVGLLAANAISLLAFDVPSARLVLQNNVQPNVPKDDSLHPRWHRQTIKRLALLALPLGFATMLTSLNANIPRYFVERFLGEYDLGIFAALAYVMVAGNTVVNALGLTISPRLAHFYSDQNPTSYARLLVKALAIAVACGVLGIVVALLGGRLLLSILYQPEYSTRSDVFTLLMVAAAFQYIASFMNYGLTAARQLTIQLPLFICLTLITLLLSVILIPADGLQGAAIAIIITSVLHGGAGALLIVRAIRQVRPPTGQVSL